MSWAPQSPDLTGYAPQSPDLSAYNSSNHPRTAARNNNNNTSWAPQSPNISAYQQSYDNQPQFAQQPPQFSLNGTDNRTWDQKPQQPNQVLSSHYPQYPQQQPIYNPQQQQYQYDMPPTTRGHRVSYKEETFKEEDDDWATRPQPAPHMNHPSVKPDLGALADPSFGSIPPAAAPTRPKIDTRGIEVKTKFPTARIKRIMQADEDVGKVAQVTPVVVAKALELFMIRLITASSTIAKSKGSKKVSTAHMKMAVMGDEQFDNLRDIVGKVPDAPVKKLEEDGEDEDGEGGPKKRKKSTAGAGRKKRKDSDEE
ncbi:hypothetical protein MBLNU457_4894t1 [Dothideomycetes sp. NU457]